MDKKSVVRKRFNYKTKAKCAFLLGLVLGMLLVCYGGVQLYFYRKERGNMTVQELSDESEKYALEAGQYEKEKNAELKENGRSKKYLELSSKWAEATKKATATQHGIYMDETGYHNPRNFWELITTVPLLFVGIICIAAGFIARYVIIEKGKLAEKTKKKEEKK